jgi:FkbM family methyltransferase
VSNNLKARVIVLTVAGAGAVSLGLGFVVLAQRHIDGLLEVVQKDCEAQLKTTVRALSKPRPAKPADQTSCTDEQADEVPRYYARLREITERIVRESKLLKKDADTGCELWSTPRGPYWLVAGNMTSMASALAEQEVQIYAKLGGGVRAGDIVLDCGAHLGAFTRTALNAGARLVVAIDISPDNVTCLRKTFEKEVKLGKVKIYSKGVWNKDDEMELFEDGNTQGDTVVFHKKTKGRKVPLTTIDKITRELALPTVNFIKMDIEGAEAPAVQGALETLKKFRPRMAVSAYHLATDMQLIPWAARLAVPDYWIAVPECKAFFGSRRPTVIMFQ